MTRVGACVAGILLLGGGVAAGWAIHKFWAHQAGGGHADADDEEAAVKVKPEEMRVKVETEAATAGDLPIVVDAVGTVRAERSAACTISSRASGRIAEVLVTQGQGVKKGEVLARFETEPLRAAVSDKQAARDLARNALTEFDKVGRERQIVELTTALRGAESELRLDEAQVARLTPLVKDKLVADKVFDEATQAAEKARRDRDRAAQALSAYESTGAALQRASLETTRAAAEAALVDAEAVLAEADVHAREDGQVTAVLVRRGDKAEAGAPLGTLLCTRSRLIVFGVPPGTAPLVKPGAPAFWIDAAGLMQPGTVDRVVGEIDAATGLASVIVTPGPDVPETPPGLLVKGEIEVDRRKDAVLVPARAVIRSSDKLTVAVVKKGRLKVVEVEVIGRHKDVVAIEGEVAAGDTVVVEGGYGIPDGAGVEEHEGGDEDEEHDESRPAESRSQPESRGK